MRCGDPLDELTQLLHRAFSGLARQGIACQCASQPVEKTRERAARGECFIAVTGAQIIGTITLEPPDRGAAIVAYRDAATASVHQLAVDPTRQGEGVGGALVAYAAAWASARRYRHLALDTPEGALAQVAWYLERGFDVVEKARVPGRGYGSVVLSRRLAACRGIVSRRIGAPSTSQSHGAPR
jgi:GNAT superfamily N-acetyltransferase